MRHAVQISRDPFARTTLYRQLCFASPTGCSWCGSFRQRRGRQLPHLFEYVTESDGGSKSYHTGKFCSKSCHDTYHNHHK